jgi:hypothetical protein
VKSPFQRVRYFLGRLGRFRNYVSFSEKSWRERLASYDRSLADDELNIGEFGGKRDHWADLADLFPQYHRRASFLMLFAMFEDDLNELCRSIASKQKLTQPLENIKGRGIERARAWLRKVARLDVGRIDAEWQKIKAYQDVRNVLIHAAGFLDASNPQHDRVVKFSRRKESGLAIRRYARVEVNLSAEFLLAFIDTLERLYASLVSLVP